MAGMVGQRVMFGMLYTSYLLNVYMRRAVTFAMVDIAKTQQLEESQMGLILSSQMLSYAVSKFVCGILVDLVSPRLALAAGLFGIGSTVLAFACVEGSPLVFTGIWFLNGIACGPGWPAAALIMKQWFRKDQFGTAWSTLSTSMNVAGTVGPLVTAYTITVSGWRTSLIIPGVLGLVFGALCLLVVKDSPAEPVNTDNQTDTDQEQEESPAISRWQLFGAPGFPGICVAYGIVCLVQYGTLQWGPVYLVNDKKQNILTGNSYVSSIEMGGIVGSLVAGYCSDDLLRKNPGIPNHIIRQSVIAWFTAGLAGLLYITTYWITPQSQAVNITSIGFFTGFCIYGPISIFGVVAMETVPDHLAGTAHAVACLFSNIGQTVAGLPLTYIVQAWGGWYTAFLVQLMLVAQTSAYLFFLHAYQQNIGQTVAGLPLTYIAQAWGGWSTAFLVQLMLVAQTSAYLFFYTRWSQHRGLSDKKET